MRSGARCKRSSANAAPLGRMPAFRAALASCVPHALRLPPTGRPGPIPCRSCSSVVLMRRGDVCGSSLRRRSCHEAAVAGDLLRRHWPERPSWQDILARAAPPAVADDSEPDDWPHGWELLASRALDSHFCETELLPHMRPSDRACLRSQSGPHAGAWLAAVPTDLPPAHMHFALRRRLRLALPLTQRYCGGDGFPGCGAVLDVLGDYAAACPRSGLLARRAWVRVAREGLGPEGRVVSQQWLANTSAPGVSAQDRRGLDLVL